jgi:LPXTG-site transpeptidase (sortase) family protein
MKRIIITVVVALLLIVSPALAQTSITIVSSLGTGPGVVTSGVAFSYTSVSQDVGRIQYFVALITDQCVYVSGVSVSGWTHSVIQNATKYIYFDCGGSTAIYSETLPSGLVSTISIQSETPFTTDLTLSINPPPTPIPSATPGTIVINPIDIIDPSFTLINALLGLLVIILGIILGLGVLKMIFNRVARIFTGLILVLIIAASVAPARAAPAALLQWPDGSTMPIIEAPRVEIPAGYTWDVSRLGQTKAGHLSGADQPGGANTVIAGHTPGMFNRLRELIPGDLISIEWQGHTYIYSVLQSLLTTPQISAPALTVPDDQYSYLTLITCDDFPVKGQRLIVRAILLAGE